MDGGNKNVVVLFGKQALLNPTEDPYDTATVPVGTLYHDILRRSDHIKVQANWIYFNAQAGEW